jgi:predicted AAA+ superfamily ATPase
MKSIYTIKRHLESTIETISKQFKCVIVTGPRQIGKSTILNEVLPKIKHFNYVKLDNDEIVNHAKNDPNGFLDSHPAPLFIDEVQKAPRLFSYIKSIVDRSDERGQFVVTGSESFELMKGVGDHLSTRAAVISMQSLSISEINGTENFVFDPNFAKFLKRKQPSLTQLQIFEKIIKGSMPDIINGNITNNNVFYEAYVKSTITKDMKED